MSRGVRQRSRTNRRPAAVTPARWVAWRTIFRTFTEDAWTDRAWAGEVERSGLEGRDRAFSQRCAFGAVQQAKRIDHIIATVGKRPLRKLDPPVLAALRLGVFEILNGTGADDHAAVSQAVEIVRAVVGERAVAFTNAILRRSTVDADDILASLDESNLADRAVLLSMPEWLVHRMHKQHGDRGLAALAALNDPAPHTSFRINTVLASAAEIDAKLAAQVDVVAVDDVLSAACPDARMVAGSTSALSPLIEAGLVQPQGRASQLAALALNVHPGEHVLDLCAAPGGKTMVIAAQLAGSGSVTACEIHDHRAASISYLASRMGVSGLVHVVCSDARSMPTDQQFDRVLVDAPCSGVGVLGRRPDARWKITEQQVEELARLQEEILAHATLLVRPGGSIIYATCTMLQEECERVVVAVETVTGVSQLQRAPLPACVPRELCIDDAESMARIWPHESEADGFFMAHLQRVERAT